MFASVAKAPATTAKFEFRLRSTEKTGFAGAVNQLGINMVDLMMWLVIAALLLAAALQGIGFYQKAAWNYQLDSDASAVRTYMEAQYTLNNNVYPTFTTAPADLKLTTDNGVANTAATNAVPAAGGWSATVCSAALKKATSNASGSAVTITSAAPGVITNTVCP